MSIILNIDTAVESASICVAQDDKPLDFRLNSNPRDSAAWLHQAIRETMEIKNLQLSQLDAIAISEGPGSYTGLRVGMAAAKGLCYALQIPLISINTLQMMASSATGANASLLCPMIDARRMEVFAAVFDHQLNTVVPTLNLILEKESFKDILDKNTVLFFGNGSTKFKNLLQHPNALFADVLSSASNMVSLSYQRFCAGDFASLAYSEPKYGKDFHSILPNS